MATKKQDRLIDKIGAFTTIPNSFIESAADIPHSAFKLFCYLRYCINTRRNDEDVFPSYNAIRRYTGLSRTSIQKGLNWLCGKDVTGTKDEPEHAWITRRRRFSASTIYTLVIPPVVHKSGLLVVHKSGLMQSTKVDSNNTNRTTRNQQHEGGSAGARGGGGNKLNATEETIAAQLREHGVKTNGRTTELVRRIAIYPYAADVIAAQAQQIAQDRNARNKAALLLTTLEAFSWTDYKPKRKVTYRAKDE